MAGLASRLSRRNHHVTLITLDDGSQNRHPLDAAVSRVPLDVMGDSGGIFRRLVGMRRRLRAVRDAIRKLCPEVVLVFCDRTNVLALTALSRQPFPVIVCERSDPRYQQLGTIWEWQRRRSYPRAAQVVALTETVAAALQPLTPRPVVVIPSAVEPPPIVSDRVAAQGRRRLIGVGRLEREKGFDRLIEAFARVHSRHAGWRLQILGEGRHRQPLEALAESLGVASAVEMPGWVSPIWEPLAEATIFALPSRYEGFPSALLEAMAVGVPCVAVDCESGPRAIIDDHQNGLLVDNTTTALADGIDWMIERAEAREAMAASGKAVLDRFGWEPMVDAYERLLERHRR